MLCTRCNVAMGRLRWHKRLDKDEKTGAVRVWLVSELGCRNKNCPACGVTAEEAEVCLYDETGELSASGG